LGGAKYFDCKRATAFGLGDGLSKHKTTRDARKLGGYSKSPVDVTLIPPMIHI